MHALIIEDEALISSMIEEILRDCGFSSFDLAFSCQEAVACAQRTCPDLITSDVELRLGNGIEAVKLICSGPRIPVIFITSCAAEVTSTMPLLPCLLKPFPKEALICAVEEVFAAAAGRPVTEASRLASSN